MCDGMYSTSVFQYKYILYPVRIRTRCMFNSHKIIARKEDTHTHIRKNLACLRTKP